MKHTHAGHEVTALMRFADAGPLTPPLMTGQTRLISRGVLSPSARLLLHQARQKHASNGTDGEDAGKTHRGDPPGKPFATLKKE